MDNAVYTPSPATVDVHVYTSIQSDRPQVVLAGHITPRDIPAAFQGGTYLRTETARVTRRGNLYGDVRGETLRWHTIELADGREYRVLLPGS